MTNSDLNDILTSVAKGRLSPAEAKPIIERSFRGAKEGTSHSEQGEQGEGFLSAFERLRKSVHSLELLKVGSGLIQQIADTMPSMPPSLERLQENFSASLPTLGFSTGTAGVEGRLSVFRTFHVSSDSTVTGNQVVGSQWFGVNFSDAAEVCSNKFTAVQFSEVAVLRSTLTGNNLSLSRLSNCTFQESRVESNRLSRSTFVDVSFTETDLEDTRLLKSEFTRTVMNASRVAGCSFDGVSFSECEFDGCELQGVTFENCSFQECVFEGVEMKCKEPLKISGRTVSGRTFSKVRSVPEFLQLLDAPDAGVDEGEGAREESGRVTRRARGSAAGQASTSSASAPSAPSAATETSEATPERGRPRRQRAKSGSRRTDAEGP